MVRRRIIPDQLFKNLSPRLIREMTNAERQALGREVEALHAALHALPQQSPTLIRIGHELRLHADGTKMPNGMDRHPASEEFEDYESDLEEVFDAVITLVETIDETLARLRARLQPWTPTK